MTARSVVLAGHGVGDRAAIDRAWASDDATLRMRALGAMARLGTLRVAERMAALRDVSPEVRRRACELEAHRLRPSSRARAELVARLADDDALVVCAAADALGELTAREAVGPLADTARSHVDARCREAAVAALGAIGAPGGLDAILEATQDKPAVRRRAVVALAAFSGPSVEEALVAAAADRDWQVRQVAESLRSTPRD